MPNSVIQADIAKFFTTDDFAVSAVVNSGDSVEVIFSKRYSSWDGGRAEVETQPVELLAASSAGLAHDDTLTIDGVDYVIVHIEAELDIDRIWCRAT